MKQWEKQEIDPAILRHLLNQMSMPARRHRCDLCRLIFECHLCSVEADHILHSFVGELICEPCIEEHSLWVAVRRDASSKKYVGEKKTTSWPDLSPNGVTFYDHLTGEMIGMGCARHTGYAFGRTCASYFAETEAR